MSLVRKSDYAREAKGTRRSVGYKTTARGARLPTQYKSSTYDQKFLIECPTGCTQHRTFRKNRLVSKNTFDIRTNECRNCGFKKLPKDAKLGAGFKKASEL